MSSLFCLAPCPDTTCGEPAHGIAIDAERKGFTAYKEPSR